MYEVPNDALPGNERDHIEVSAKDGKPVKVIDVVVRIAPGA